MASASAFTKTNLPQSRMYYEAKREDHIMTDREKELTEKYKKATIAELSELDPDLLYEISMIKKKNYCASPLALKAQGIIHRRNPMGHSSYHWMRDHSGVKI